MLPRPCGRESGSLPSAFDLLDLEAARLVADAAGVQDRAAVAELASGRRGIATRYQKTAAIYLAGLHVAGIFLRSAR
ncbi:hypothetical protein QOM21_01980 [Streptomyces sp. Pv4-95]|uniref:hypothetical protein n=1 Tax=Streptomyces sp. Pv4-95 TaxID=3049543 RepID=UPI0038929510